ncbi:hypothetical protein [Phycicoccus flavus]|uniref:hypothetical protein n=1 Tax=Phycicoccus flavus TaxID=2502783 RepID=UPI000FEBB598|nr:hypothetical protein [Phycicoccus flavus]NHA69162.1 hypothetical protein [Phycicoccus flavus]
MSTVGTSAGPRTDLGSDPAPASPPIRTRRLAVAVVAAALAGLVVAALVPSPWLAVPWAVALVVLGPTSDRLDRRLAVNLALVLGLLPVTLWLPPLLGARTAAVAALALGTAAVAGGVATRQGSLLPRVRARDGVVGAIGVLAAVVALPLALAGTPARALAMLSTGIDNAYHFAMFLEQRLGTAGSPLLAARADGSGFAFDDYPQWFHKTLTVLAQLAFGDPGSAPLELVRFARLEWVVFVLLAVLVTAAVLQALPDRVAPSLLVAVTAVLASLLLGVPGGINLLQGHLSFLVAACAPLVMFLLATGRSRPGVGLFVVLGGLVLATAAWLLLLPMAGAALLVPVVAVWRRQSALVRWGTLAGMALALVLAFLLFVRGPLLTGGGFSAVLRDGTVPRVGLPTSVPVLLGCLAVVVVLAVRHHGLGLWGHVLLVLAAVVQVAVLGGYMLAAAGTLTYYFWKLMLGSLLVAVLVTVHALVRVLAQRSDAGRIRPLLLTVPLLVAAAGLGLGLQTFTAPSAVWAAILPGSLESRTTSGDAGDVDLVLRLAATTPPQQAARTRLLATRPGDMNAAHASEWFHDLSHSATRRAVSVDDGVYDLAKHPDNTALAVRLAADTLATTDGLVVVTDPALDAAVRQAVPDAADRVTLVD